MFGWKRYLLAAFAAVAVAQETFTNPVVYEDFADNDVTLGPDGLYYFSASNMHFSPGAPILRSADLVNWEIIGHSVPTLNFGENYDLQNGQAYRRGTWASTMRYRKSNKLWYWIGCVDFWYSYTYTAPSPEGPWTRRSQSPGGQCYYDCGLLVDDDDQMYVVYGATNVNVALLNADGFSQNKSQPVFSASDVGQDGIEGNRMYKRNGLYYILDDHPGDTTYIWKSTSPFGPYESKILLQGTQSSIPSGGVPHQGSLIETPNGDWFYMSFTWAYPSGRIPVLAPITWGDDGFPILTTDANGAWGKTYPLPLPAGPTTNWTGTDTFPGTTLSPAWEWNHNPDTTRYTINDGLTLSTATITPDLFLARNTLTHRVHGEFPRGTVLLDISSLTLGDRAGLSAFRDKAAAIQVFNSNGSLVLQNVQGMTQDQSTWTTTSLGVVDASVPLPEGTTRLWLRCSMDARAAGDRLARFSWSVDGETWEELGEASVMSTDWQIFMGYRFGIFNYATGALGGSVKVVKFESV
ncbi:hypothetical protein KVT40_000153 [Elsinoe batatas]|uniref:Beta-xylosidase C-terminal Concanavalin A-like domain-containing protein n=1 Tax=Elsinoe batatas TaxID=2601811 RepID=A0A8K0LF24_9PEZI|nr:hypothetical protein KVT40_000153 [Elsinoe batatas]